MYPFLQPKCDITAMMAAATSITIALCWECMRRPKETASCLGGNLMTNPIFWSQEANEAGIGGWDRVVFFWQKTKLGFLYEWNLEPAAQPPSSLPDYSPVSWTMWSPVAQVATDHVESWKFDFKLLCRKCGKHCTLASDGFWFSFIFRLPTIFCEEHCGWSNWKILWFS